MASDRKHVSEIEPMDASVCIRNRNNAWMEDNMVSKCHGCQVDFTILNKKHHCRSCGNIICDKCSLYIKIPDFMTDVPEEKDVWNVSYYFTFMRKPEKRVCETCYQSIITRINSHEKIMLVCKNLSDINKIKALPDSQSDVKNYYFDHFRNIQYYFPDHVYSELDVKILEINAPYISTHSKYLMHLIKSRDWSTQHSDHLKLIISTINGQQKCRCDELFCTRTCQERLSFDDAVSILYTHALNLPDDLLDYLWKIISQTPDLIIRCHLSFFINLIKINGTSKKLVQHLIDLLTRDKITMYQTYWYLRNAQSDEFETTKSNVTTFLKLFPLDHLEIMSTSYDFFEGLIENLDQAIVYLIKNIKKQVVFPYDPDIHILGVDFENISSKQSYTQPVIIPFITNHGVIKLLFKRENVMNDIAVLNLMTLSDIILGETLNEEIHKAFGHDDAFGNVIYPVMALTANSGVIEIIDDAETIYNITKKKKSILEYIIFNNVEKKPIEFLTKYQYSLVSYTVHSYLLGLGDRHLENIMITDDGMIFHIDFGFILGSEAYPLSGTEVKLSTPMLDVIGGKDSDMHERYIDLCAKSIIILRKYFNMFYILLVLSGRFPKEHIASFIMSRFQVRQPDAVVVSALMEIITKSNDAFSSQAKDWLHRTNQEQYLQTSLTAAVSTVKNLFGMLNFTSRK
jgi:hypothetical protein